MALRLRRGTDAERLLITPLEGELLYITDTKELYIGDGTTLGGVRITGQVSDGAGTLDELSDVTLGTLQNNDILAYDAVTEQWIPTQMGAPELAESGDYRFSIINEDSSVVVDHVNSIHYGSFYGSVFNADGALIFDPTNATITSANGDNFINITTREVVGTLQGYVIGEDSTVVVNGYNGNINANVVYASDSFRGNLKGNVTGDTSGTHFGPVTGDVVGNLTGSVNGDVVGNLTGNVLGNVTGDVTGNVVGSLVGDVAGSVFSDDSTKIVDGVNATLHTRSLDIVNNVITGDGVDPVRIANDNNTAVAIRGITDGTYGSQLCQVALQAQNGTIDTPTDTAQDDFLTSLSFNAYYGGVYKPAGSISTKWESTATLTNNTPEAVLSLHVGAGDGNGFGGFGSHIATFDSLGVFKAPILKTDSYATGDIPVGATVGAGSIVFDSTTNEFKGWNGSSWVVLG
jgi:hypothetical protein